MLLVQGCEFEALDLIREASLHESHDALKLDQADQWYPNDEALVGGLQDEVKVPVLVLELFGLRRKLIGDLYGAGRVLVYAKLASSEVILLEG